MLLALALHNPSQYEYYICCFPEGWYHCWLKWFIKTVFHWTCLVMHHFLDNFGTEII